MQERNAIASPLDKWLGHHNDSLLCGIWGSLNKGFENWGFRVTWQMLYRDAKTLA